MGVYRDREAGYWVWDITDRIFIHTLNDWDDLYHALWPWAKRRYNWYTFRLAHIEFEKDAACAAYELTVLILGLGLRLRWNTKDSDVIFEEWERRVNESRERLERGEGDDLDRHIVEVSQETDNDD